MRKITISKFFTVVARDKQGDICISHKFVYQKSEVLDSADKNVPSNNPM